MRILSIRIVLSCFYPLISHFELEFATNAMHNLPIDGKREKAARGKNVLLDQTICNSQNFYRFNGVVRGLLVKSTKYATSSTGSSRFPIRRRHIEKREDPGDEVAN